MAHKVHNAGLHRGVGEGRVDGVREALEAVNNGDEDVLHTPVAQVVHDRQPEFCPFVGRDPQAQYLTFAFRSDAKGHVDRLVLDLAAFRIPDFDPERVKENDWVHRLQRAILPVRYLSQNRVSYAADQVGGNLQAVNFFKVGADVAGRQTRRVKPDDFVIHPVDPGLAFLDQLRFETAIAVTRDINRHRPVIALQHLASRPVAAVGLLAGRLALRLIAQVLRQFGTQHPLHQPDLQFLHQALVAKQILGSLNPAKQLVQ